MMRPENAISGLYVDRPVIRHGVLSVDNQVVDDLRDLGRVNLDRPQILRDRELAAHVRAGEGERGRLPEERGERGDTLDRAATLGEGQQLVRELRGPQAGRFRFGEAIEQLLLRGWGQ